MAKRMTKDATSRCASITDNTETPPPLLGSGRPMTGLCLPIRYGGPESQLLGTQPWSVDESWANRKLTTEGLYQLGLT